MARMARPCRSTRSHLHGRIQGPVHELPTTPAAPKGLQDGAWAAKYGGAYVVEESSRDLETIRRNRSFRTTP